MEVQELREMPYGRYLQTPHWRQVRKRKLAEASDRCQLCNSPDRLDVHHRTYERLGEELLSDLTVLCRPCHSRHHGHQARPLLPNHRRALENAPSGVDLVREHWDAIHAELREQGYVRVSESISTGRPERFEGRTLILRFGDELIAKLVWVIGRQVTSPLQRVVTKVTGVKCTGVRMEGPPS